MISNPLHTPEYYLDQYNLKGYVDLSRMTGRTTALAFEAIAKALLEPRRLVPIRDHHGTRVSDVNLKNKIQDIIRETGLSYMEVKRDNNEMYLTFGETV